MCFSSPDYLLTPDSSFCGQLHVLIQILLSCKSQHKHIYSFSNIVPHSHLPYLSLLKLSSPVAQDTTQRVSLALALKVLLCSVISGLKISWVSPGVAQSSASTIVMNTAAESHLCSILLCYFAVLWFEHVTIVFLLPCHILGPPPHS